MRSEHADIERIEAYVEGRMSDAERGAFEERLLADSALVHDLYAYRVTRKALVDLFAEEHERAAVKGNVVRLDNARKSSWRWAAAAAVVLLFGAGAWYSFGTKASLPELAERYAVKESPLPVFMSADRPPQVIMDEAMQAFGANDYATAIERLAQLPSTDTTLFFTALAQAQVGLDATAAFEDVAQQQDSPLRNKSLYHLMVQAMQANDGTTARRIWREQIPVKNHPYRDRLEAIAFEMGWKP